MIDAPRQPHPPRRRVTMQDVGRLAGVSQVTVSRALSDPSKVSQSTLDKVMSAIQATGFVPNAAAGALASRRSRLISALVPSITNIVYSSLIRAFSERIRSHGYQTLLSETGFDLDDEETAVRTHLSRQPDAILMTGIHHSRETRRMLMSSETPVVEVWDISDTPIDICVGFDHASAARTVADFAVSRGYLRAATITADDLRARQRQRAFADHFQSSTGFAVFDANIGGPASIARGRSAIGSALEQLALAADAPFVFCSSDLLAHGAMIEVAKRGLAVPGNIAIMGFGDQEFADALEPPLTSLRVDRSELGHRAADALISRLSGEPVDPIIRIGFEIAHRATV